MSTGCPAADSLKGRTAVVTGAATGVGQGIALALAQQGANLAVTYNRAPADRTMALLRETGARAVSVRADTSSRESIRALFQEAADTFGGVDILVNDAAIQLNRWLLEYTEEEYDRMMRVNLMGYWRCIQEAAPYLKQSPCGRVINVASIHAKRPTDFDPVYAMTKGAVKMLTREAAIELSPWGVTVNSLELGAIQVPTRSGNPGFKRHRELAIDAPPDAEFLSGRRGAPADAGYLAAFLASAQSQFINGSGIRADGGVMLVTP